MSAMRKPLMRHFIHAIILISGLVLMIGGIINGKHGATGGGIIVAGVNVQQWLQWAINSKGNENKIVRLDMI
jgi:hypothetical protein